jgi:hypothetical protein
MQGYAKLFSTIITSSIWSADDKTRIVWITMLALADRYGNVQASIPGLAATARVTLQECEAAVRTLSNPDPYSRSTDSEGRRIEPIEGGWHLLNYVKYRRMKRSAERTEYLRIKQREHRERLQKVQKHKQPVNKSVNKSTTVNPCQPIAEAEAEKKKRVLKNNEEEEGRPPRQVFDHWNTYAGRSIQKPEDHGRQKPIAWHGHKTRPDGSIPTEIERAIRQALAGHTLGQVCAAIDNYAKVLLGPDYKWTYVWTLPEFLTRGEEPHKQAPRKWWRFLPDNFIEEHHRRTGAQARIGAPLVCDANGLTPRERVLGAAT